MAKKVMLFLSVVMTLGLVLGDMPCAWAEDDELDEFTLEEITVTAQKREEDQQKVPIAMEVISGEQMAEQGLDNVDEILYQISNVLVNTSADGMRISLRGLADEGGNFNNLQTSEPTVAVNIDGAYTNQNTAGQNLFDVERVEVLFGPQSTMYSSNSPGGIVNIVTASPKTDAFSVSGSIQYGSYELMNLQGTLNVPINDKTAIRLATSKSKQNSWVSTEGTGSKSTSVRLRTLYKATDNLSFTITGNHTRRGSGGRMGNTVVPFADQDDVDDPWTTSGDDGLGTANKSDNITKSVSADIAWKSKFGSFTIVPSYSESMTEGTEAGRGGGGPPGGGGGRRWRRRWRPHEPADQFF